MAARRPVAGRSTDNHGRLPIMQHSHTGLIQVPLSPLGDAYEAPRSVVPAAWLTNTEGCSFVIFTVPLTKVTHWIWQERDDNRKVYLRPHNTSTNMKNELLFFFFIQNVRAALGTQDHFCSSGDDSFFFLFHICVYSACKPCLHYCLCQSSADTGGCWKQSGWDWCTLTNANKSVIHKSTRRYIWSYLQLTPPCTTQ